MRKLSHQDLINLVDGAAIFSAGGEGDPETGFTIVDGLAEGGYEVKLIDSSEVPDDTIVINLACVGATTAVAYDSDAAAKTFQLLEEYLGRKAYAHACMLFLLPPLIAIRNEHPAVWFHNACIHTLDWRIHLLCMTKSPKTLHSF
ncbi:MAG: DUF917 family protein [Candidatus Bathyarchaeota archaeon]|nr:MAG: DUF917 family protein [Candidatus Bathyarchaeota archaeon]